jgi:hypothetical protein
MQSIDTIFDSDGDYSAQSVIQRSGSIYFMEVQNPNTVDAYIQLFDVVTTGVTVGSTTPKQSFIVPAQGAMDKQWRRGLKFNTAISYACTTEATNGVDPTTGLTVNIGYL